jgi:hypothetical protein
LLAARLDNAGYIQRFNFRRKTTPRRSLEISAKFMIGNNARGALSGLTKHIYAGMTGQGCMHTAS